MARKHMFCVKAAEEVGISAAVILEHLSFYCEKNRSNGVHEHDGLYWTHISIPALVDIHPYLSATSVKTAVKKLKDGGYIRVEKLSGFGYDRTNWYAVTEAGELLVNGSDSVPCIGQNQPMDGTILADGSAEIDRCNIDIKDILKDTVIDSVQSDDRGHKRRSAFTKPTPSEVTAYATSIGKQIDGDRFCDYYESRGWMVGKSPMKDWKAAVRNWTRNSPRPAKPTADFSAYDY